MEFFSRGGGIPKSGEKMIPPRGGDFAVAAVLPEGRLRRFSRLSQGSERKRCHGRVAKERFLARFEELVGARAA